MTTTTPDITQLTKETARSFGGLKVESVAGQTSYINMLLYGNPGAGKTRLAGSASLVPQLAPVLFVDVEGGTLSLRDIYPNVDVVRVQTWKEMQGVYDELYRGTEYKTVVCDSLTEIQKFSMLNIMTELVKDKPDRDPDIPSVQEWGKNIEQTRKFVRAFRDLPMNTILTALAKEDKDPKTGNKQTLPYLSGKLASEVAGFMDIVSYMYLKKTDGELKRYLLSGATDKEVAKDRTDRLPLVMEEPVMQDLFDLINATNP